MPVPRVSLVLSHPSLAYCLFSFNYIKNHSFLIYLPHNWFHVVKPTWAFVLEVQEHKYLWIDQERCSSSWFKPCLKTVTSQGFTSFTQCTIMERAHVLFMQGFNTCKGYSTTEEREGRQLERNQQTAKHCPPESFLNPTGCSLSLDCDPLRSICPNLCSWLYFFPFFPTPLASGAPAAFAVILAYQILSSSSLSMFSFFTLPSIFLLASCFFSVPSSKQCLL